MICENHKKKEKNPVRSKKKGAHREFGWPHRVQLNVCAEDLQWGFTKHMCRPGSVWLGTAGQRGRDFHFHYNRATRLKGASLRDDALVLQCLTFRSSIKERR